MITVEVVLARAGHSLQRRVVLADGSTVMQAIDASGILDMLPDGVLDASRVGVFSHKVALDHRLTQGDRIELYRPLLLDPMEARRRRAG